MAAQNPLRLFALLFLLTVHVNSFAPFQYSKRSTTTTTRFAKLREDEQKNRHFPQRVVEIYTDYAGRLWNETAPAVRRRITNDKISASIRQLQQVSRTSTILPREALSKLDDACNSLLNAIVASNALAAENQTSAAVVEEFRVDAESVNITVSSSVDAPPDNSIAKKPRRSIMRGVIMGAIVAAWVFSGNYIFTGLFTLMTTVGQLEYYRMIMNTGVYPARRISVMGACSMFLTALFFPDLHQICLPLFGLYAMVWFLTMRRSVATISEIATTFTGMFYLGYVPSFWVRIRLLGASREPTRLAPLLSPIVNFIQGKATQLPSWIPQAVHLPITTGAIFIFWSWLCLAFSDVGAYFVGKNFGKTKLGSISPAAGAASPNKTLEGVLGGCAVSGSLGVLGAWIMRWPFFFWTGAIHGVMLALLGLLGDLTASMLKRDAGLKDFGDLIPEHGGVLDRVDSFVWSAPYSWLVCAYIIPFLKSISS